MSYKSTYMAASAVASRVEEHFAKHLADAQKKGEKELATAPGARIAEEIIDVSFWASLRKEEGHSPKISIAYLSPSQAGSPLLFGERLPLTPGVLAKLGPGVERAGIHLGVWSEGNELYIWGTTTKIPNLCFVLDVSQPSLLVIKHRRVYGLGKYTNVAVLKGDQIKIIDEYCAGMTDSPAILASLLGYNSSPLWNDPVNVLIQMAVSMRAHQHGGCLLVVPAGTEEWNNSIVQPMQYPVVPSFPGLKNLIRQEPQDGDEIFWQSALRREIDNVAGLTAIDGATVINDQQELLAFGVKIGRAKGKDRVEEISLKEPVVGDKEVVVHPSQMGGTRHLSASQFVYDQRDAMALVSSQDDHFTIFKWSPSANIVQAYRIDTLLL